MASSMSRSREPEVIDAGFVGAARGKRGGMISGISRGTAANAAGVTAFDAVAHPDTAGRERSTGDAPRRALSNRPRSTADRVAGSVPRAACGFTTDASPVTTDGVA